MKTNGDPELTDKQLRADSVGRNFSYQFLYQMLMLVVPLIISPYLTRRLGSKTLGIHSYVNSIAYYFVLACNLGISKYGQRLIAQSCGNEIQLRKDFWSLFSLHILSSAVSMALYWCFIALFADRNASIFRIESLFVLSAMFDITWLFYGLQNFRSVVIKNGAVKLIECVLIFAFVREPGDLWKYTLIVSGCVLAGQAVMIPQAIRIVKPVRFEMRDVNQHIRPVLLFAVSVFAISLYTVFDKTLLGLLSTMDNVAYYEYANKIILLPRTFITIISTVLFPRSCKLAAEGDRQNQQRYFRISMLIVAFMGFGAMFGLCAVAEPFAVIYYGSDFALSGKVMIAMSALPIIIGVGNTVRSQYMIPNGLDKQYMICILMNSVVNLILSTLLIPKCGVFGAVIGTCAAELFGCIYQIIICKKLFSVSAICRMLIPFFVIGVIMYAAMRVAMLFIPITGAASLVIIVAIGAVLYVGLCCVYTCFVNKKLGREILLNIRRK